MNPYGDRFEIANKQLNIYLGIYLIILKEMKIRLPQELFQGGLLLDWKPLLAARRSAGMKAK